MGSHQFDKQIKDKLQFHKAEVNPVLWDKIEAHIPGPENSRRIAFWWLSSAVVAGLLLTVGVLWFAHDSDNKPSNTTTTPEAESGQIMASVTSSKETALPIEAKAWSNTKPVSEEDNTSGKMPQMATVSSYNKKRLSEATNEVNSQADHLTQSEESRDLPSYQTATSEIVVTNEEAKHARQQSLAFLGQHPVYPFSTKSKKVVIKDNCLDDFNHGKRGVSLEAYFGNDFPIRTLDARDPNFDHIVQTRKETETPLYSFSLGARLGFTLNEEFKIMTGVHYSQINEKFEFVDPESSQTKIVKTTLYIKDGNGMIKDSTFSYDTVYIPGTLIYKIRNQYTMIDLPFLVGWKVHKSQKMSIYANAGIMANLAFKKEGMALVDDQYVVRSFENMNASTFNHSLGISTYIGAQFAYQIQPGFDIFLEPNVRMQHRGLTTKDHPVKQRYTTPSILIGSKYNF